MKRFKTALILMLVFSLLLSIYSCKNNEVREIEYGREAYIARINELEEKIYDTLTVTGTYYEDAIHVILVYDKDQKEYIQQDPYNQDLEGVVSVANTHADFFMNWEDDDSVDYAIGDMFTIQYSDQGYPTMWLFDENGNVTFVTEEDPNGDSTVTLTFKYN